MSTQVTAPISLLRSFSGTKIFSADLMPCTRFRRLLDDGIGRREDPSVPRENLQFAPRTTALAIHQKRMLFVAAEKVRLAYPAGRPFERARLVWLRC
jgi:hypothetical protein